MTDYEKSQAQSRETWKVGGDLFDTETTPVDRTAAEQGLAKAGIRGLSVEQTPARNNRPKSADELLSGTAKDMRLLGQTDERLAYQAGRPRPASPPPAEQRPPRRPRRVETTDDDFFDDPLGKSRGNGTIG